MMLRIFKRRSPQHRRPAHRVETLSISPQDHAVAVWNGITDQHWANLPAIVKVDMREAFYSARGL